MEPVSRKMTKQLRLIKSAYRRTWGAISPVERVVPSKKVYNRQKAKNFRVEE